MFSSKKWNKDINKENIIEIRLVEIAELAYILNLYGSIFSDFIIFHDKFIQNTLIKVNLWDDQIW